MSVALTRPLPTFVLLEKFFNAKMQLKIYHLLLLQLLYIIIYSDYTFTLTLFLIYIDLFYSVNILYCYLSC